MLRNLATISGFTLMSRVLGLVRDVLMGSIIGTTAISDAFFTAFRFPNMFRRIFGEGAFNAAFVPQYAGALEEDGKESAARFASQAFSWLFWTLGVGTLVALPLMRWIMAGFAPGFLTVEGHEFSSEWFWEMVRYPHGTEKFENTVSWARIMFSYLLCMALVAQLSGVMNTLRRFAIPAFAPVLLNIVFITILSTAAFSEVGAEKAGLWISWGVCLSGFLQLLLLYVACRRIGVNIRICRPRISPRIKTLFTKMGPGVLSAGVQQFNLLIGTQIASMQAMAVSYLYYAERLYQFPLGMIGVAFGVVLLPEISRSLMGGRQQEAVQTLRDGLSFSMLLTIPASVALIVIPAEMIHVLLNWGGKIDVTQTSHGLMGFAFGIPAYVLIKVLQPAFFAQEDTKTPMFMAGITVATNIVVSLALFPLFGHVGIAIATSIAGWVNVILLLRGLRGFLTLGPRTWKTLGGIVLCSGLMGLMVLLAAFALEDWVFGGVIQRLVGIALLAGLGVSSYALMALKFKVTSLAEIKQALKR